MRVAVDLKQTMSYNVCIESRNGNIVKVPKIHKTNPVARNCRKFNKAVVHVDRKKASSRGYVKHARSNLDAEK